MVFMVCILTSFVIITFYLTILPWLVRERAYLLILFHVIVGHWLMVNIVFNYYKGVRTSPGYPPQVSCVLLWERGREGKDGPSLFYFM